MRTTMRACTGPPQLHKDVVTRGSSGTARHAGNLPEQGLEREIHPEGRDDCVRESILVRSSLVAARFAGDGPAFQALLDEAREGHESAAAAFRDAGGAGLLTL